MFALLFKALEHSTPEKRIAAAAKALHSLGPGWRPQIGEWIATLLSVETLVPDAYLRWRPLVHDCMAFVASHISEPRLIPKIVEQLELPLETPPEERLILVIAKTPGLQKLGQVLARTRKLSPSLRAALQRLENGISDMTAAEVRGIVHTGLGSLIEAYDVRLSEHILTEASVSAIIEFSWRNPATGLRESGVFKVLKPHVSLYYAEDLALLKDLAAYIASREVAEVLDDVRTLLAHEVDFRREQVMLAEVNRIYHRKGVRVPRPIPHFCTDRITAMSAERGIKVTDALRKSLFWRRRVAATIVESLIADPIFSPEPQSIFHADPHAGNLLYDEESQELVILDWALTGRLSRDERRNLARLIFAMTFRDASAVKDSIHALSTGGAAADIGAAVDAYFDALPHACSLGAIDAMRLLDAIGVQGVRFPASLVLIRKVLFTLDGVLHDIAGDTVRLDTIILSDFIRRWAQGRGALPPPFTLADLLLAQKSALRYATGAWSL